MFSYSDPNTFKFQTTVQKLQRYNHHVLTKLRQKCFIHDVEQHDIGSIISLLLSGLKKTDCLLLYVFTRKAIKVYITFIKYTQWFTFPRFFRAFFSVVRQMPGDN